MSPVHVHLLLNHVSIMAALFSVLVFLYGLLRNNAAIKNIALAGFVFAALAAIPVFLTGEPAEEAVEHLPGVAEAAIESHEEAAEVAIWLVEITGVLALGMLLFRKTKWAAGTAFAVFFAMIAIVSASSIAYTGYLGGMIRHTEIGAPPAAGGEQQLLPGNGETEEED